MPGVDIEKDIINVSTAKINLPAGVNVPLVNNDLVRGKDLYLNLKTLKARLRMAQRAKEREAELCLKERM